MPLLFAGGACCVAVFAAGAGFDAGALAGAAFDVVAGAEFAAGAAVAAGVVAGFAAGAGAAAAAGVAAGAESALFALLLDFVLDLDVELVSAAVWLASSVEVLLFDLDFDFEVPAVELSAD